MKRCPECGREYDNSMMFCLDDGSELLYGPASADEPATAILSAVGVPPSGGSSSESATRPQIQTTLEAQPPISLKGSSEGRSLSAHRAAKPRGTTTKLLTIFGIAILVLAGGLFGYRYFSLAPGQIGSI